MKKLVTFATALLLSFSLFGQESKLEDFVNESYIDELKKNGKIELIHEKEDTSLNLVPNCFYSERINSEKIEKSKKEIPFVAEFLYLVPKSELKEKGIKKLENVTMDEISVVFRSISKMQGMLYHFEKPGKEKVLYEKTYMIANLDSDEPIPDQNTGNADGQVSYCYQDDNTYGDLKFQLNYYVNGNTLYSTFLLGAPMSCMGIKAVDAGNMKISIVAVDLGDDVLIYLNTDVSAKNIALVNVRKQIKDSMTARMEAVYRWFLMQF